MGAAAAEVSNAVEGAEAAQTEGQTAAKTPTGLLLFDHLGVIVSELATGRDFLASALAISRWTPVVNDSGLQVSVQFGSSVHDALVYELIAPFGDRSPITNALRSSKHILNHVAYRTDDLLTAAGRLREQGCYPVGEPQPAEAYDGQSVQFFVSPLRFVIELIEKPEHRHAFRELSYTGAGDE